MRLLHLSDTHVAADGADARESLRGILRDCAEIPGIDAVVITGDIADDGSPRAYRDVLGLVTGFTRPRRIPAIFTTGNHDERAGFAAVLGSGHRDADGRDRPVARLDSAGGERAAVTIIGGYRIVTLDSLVPGQPYGRIGRTQLDWLEDLLAAPSPYGNLLAFHHPPLAVPGVLAQAAMGLRGSEDLAGAIAGADVRLLLCGHFHAQVHGFFAGVPVAVTPGVVNRVDLTAAPDTVRYVRGACATLVDLGGPHSPVLHTLHARDPRAGRLVREVDAERLATVLATLSI